MSSLLFPVFGLNGENAQPENMRDIVLKKTYGRGGTVTRMSVKQKQPFNGVLWKSRSENFPKIHRKITVPESHF